MFADALRRLTRFRTLLFFRVPSRSDPALSTLPPFNFSKLHPPQEFEAQGHQPGLQWSPQQRLRLLLGVPSSRERTHETASLWTHVNFGQTRLVIATVFHPTDRQNGVASFRTFHFRPIKSGVRRAFGRRIPGKKFFNLPPCHPNGACDIISA